MTTTTKPRNSVVLCEPGNFDQENHFYEKVINATLSTVVSSFLSMNTSNIIARYLHLNPSADEKKLREMLEYKPDQFRWAGADLFNCTTDRGIRRMILIETNSCPSGQKSMPTLIADDDMGGYIKLMERTFKPVVQQAQESGILPEGSLAVIYDKNYMEASGYANAMATAFEESVYLAEDHYGSNDEERILRWKDQIMYIKYKDEWKPMRAVFRYITKKPWCRIPLINTKTLVLNPISACLAGGRNKLVAAKAYQFLNAELGNSGLKLMYPKTIRDVNKNEVPLWVNTFGGFAVVKDPYSNAGQGVYTITSKEELKAFMDTQHDYDQFIVQALVGNSAWSSKSMEGAYYHVGTIPNRKNNIYVADLRLMIHYDFKKKRLAPLVSYARRARKPLPKEIAGDNSWDILGTNLSVKLEGDKWGTETNRLLLLDTKDFNKLGLGVDDLISAYIQTVLATVAIDKMAKRLTKKGTFDMDLFLSLNNDQALVKQILL